MKKLSLKTICIAIIGIILSVVCFVVVAPILLIFLISKFIRHRKKVTPTNTSNEPSNSPKRKREKEVVEGKLIV